jgi:hypothetical protein
MKIYLIIFIAGILVACKQQEDSNSMAFNAENDSLKAQLKGLSKELKEIKKMIEKEKKKPSQESVIPKIEQIPIVTNNKKEIPAERKTSKEKQKVEMTKVQPEALVDDRRNEKTYYYNKSKLVSLHVSAWKDDQQEFKLYDLNGKLTYEFKSVLKSYSVSVEIKSFHPNGAVNQVSVHMNPGASMYMYQTEYTFSDQNEPLTKEDFTTPARLEDFMNNVSTWNKEKRQWEK